MSITLYAGQATLHDALTGEWASFRLFWFDQASREEVRRAAAYFVRDCYPDAQDMHLLVVPGDAQSCVSTWPIHRNHHAFRASKYLVEEPA